MSSFTLRRKQGHSITPQRCVGSFLRILVELLFKFIYFCIHRFTPRFFFLYLFIILLFSRVFCHYKSIHPFTSMPSSLATPTTIVFILSSSFITQPFFTLLSCISLIYSHWKIKKLPIICFFSSLNVKV